MPNPLMCIADVQRDPPQSAQNHSPPRESAFGDSSRPLLSKEIDDRATERFQKDAECVLVFVSPHVSLYTTLRINWNCRLVYSLLLSVRCSQCLCKTSGPTLRIHRHSISRASISSSPTLILRTCQFLPLWNSHPCSRRLDMPSG